MKIRHCLLSVMANMLVLIPMQAQENVVTLKSCLEKGLKNNYSLQIVRNEQQIAENNATRANAGMMPTVNLSAGYSGTLDNNNTIARGSESTSKDRNVMDHTVRAGINAEWTVFDGFKMQANYQRLKELNLRSENQVRIAVEDFVANLTAEYYNFIQQRLRMKNLNYAVALSKERLRIVHERYMIGNNSRLDLQQAQVDFNADSAQSLKQREQLASSRIRLNQLMCDQDMSSHFLLADSVIDVDRVLDFDELWASTLQNNAELLEAAHNMTLAEIDLKSVKSRDFPYVKLNAGYSYSFMNYDIASTVRRHDWGADFGMTVGFKLYDGNRRRERKNAEIEYANTGLEQKNLRFTLYTTLADLWQAYENNKRLLELERQNLISARENYYIAHERYLLGDLSGIEMREAQKSLLDADERILVAEYNTKLCEISLLQLSGNVSTYLE